MFLSFVMEYIAYFGSFDPFDPIIGIGKGIPQPPRQATSKACFPASHVSDQEDYHFYAVLSDLKQVKLLRVNDHFVRISHGAFDLKLGIRPFDCHRIGQVEVFLIGRYITVLILGKIPFRLFR